MARDIEHRLQLAQSWLERPDNGAEVETSSSPSQPDLPPHRISPLQAYGSLPPEMRRPIRALIESLAQSLNPNYQAREAVQRRHNAVRDAVAKEPVPVGGKVKAKESRRKS